MFRERSWKRGREQRTEEFRKDKVANSPNGIRAGSTFDEWHRRRLSIHLLLRRKDDLWGLQLERVLAGGAVIRLHPFTIDGERQNRFSGRQC